MNPMKINTPACMKKLLIAVSLSITVVSCIKKNDSDDSQQFTYSVVVNKVIGGDKDDRITDMVGTSDGEHLLVGYTASNNNGDVITNHGNVDGWVVKLNYKGDTMWTRTIGGTGIDQINAATVVEGGHIL